MSCHLRVICCSYECKSILPAYVQRCLRPFCRLIALVVPPVREGLWQSAGCTGHSDGELHQADGTCITTSSPNGMLVPTGMKSVMFICGGAGNTLTAANTTIRISYADCNDCSCATAKSEVNVPTGCINGETVHDLSIMTACNTPV